MVIICLKLLFDGNCCASRRTAFTMGALQQNEGKGDVPK
jgi:hypothetical protein